MLEQPSFYKPPIPDHQRQKYEAALHKVLRWKNGNWADNIYETDMEHVAKMFSILTELNSRSSTLSSDVDIQTVKHMIYIHDAGEILTGDLTHNREDYDSLYPKWKFRERAAFRLLTRGIEDKETKLKARQLFERCFAQRQDDKEALLTEFIDKDQGLRFGFQHVFNGKGMKPQVKELRMNHAVELVRKPTNALLKLVSLSTQTDLKSFIRDEFIRFSQYGYRKEANYYLKNLDAILQWV